MNNLSDIHSIAAGKRAPRAVHTFTLPASLAGESGTASVGVVALTAAEEMMASRRSQSDPIQLAYELAKESLRTVDGRAVSTADGSADVWWENPANTKVRTLVVTAYNSVNAPSRDETSDFLKSCTVSVG